MDKYDTLNDRQKEAVYYTEGPLLILAGAGSGKTKVLTHRIAHLIEDENVAPYNIMAITFTNKAAAEMKRRVENLVEYGDSVWVATFHSSCVRILRRFIDRLGYEKEFTIYDTDDQRTVVRKAVKELDLNPKMYKERPIVAYISDCKTNLLTPEDMKKEAVSVLDRKYAEIYEWYEKRLRSNNALDFDDLLLKTVELFKTNPDVLEHYQKKFKYIMVDEYQDTNHVQFEFIYLLAKEHKNLAVVGDDDQSIYAFRGADIRNILDFEQCFPNTKVVKLEQNYRSTTRILNVANSVIRHNVERKDKRLWSNLGEGQEVLYREYASAEDEAAGIVLNVQSLVNRGEAEYRDFAILYRTNAQSRLFEDCCVNRSVPYVMVGGVNFYQREEIKDVLAYLKVIAGTPDNVALERIINKPKRGIGDTTINRLLIYGAAHGESLLETVSHAERVTDLSMGTVNKIRDFYRLITNIRAEAGLNGAPEDRIGFDELIKLIVDKVDYEDVLNEYEEDKRDQKRENIGELVTKAGTFEDKWDEEGMPTLMNFLEDVALVADVDSLDDDDNKVVLMTLHGSKGLEFPYVFIAGMEENLFPSAMSLNSDDPRKAIEEERRLCYVGMTRAMKRLTLTMARKRMLNGDTTFPRPSRFIDEIPEDCFTKEPTGFANVRKLNSGNSYENGFGGNGGFGGNNFSGNRNPGASANLNNFGNPGFGKSFPIPPAQPVKKEVELLTSLDYEVGDRVTQDRFGDGTVTAIENGKKDFVVTVNFDRSGTRTMMASFAKLRKLS